MTAYFLWFKAFHLIAMVCWFAGLFYLPRLFVYHAMSEDRISQQRFEIMERKLYRGIMTPAMILTWVFGLAMLTSQWAVLQHQHWLHLKLTLVLVLSAYHGMAGMYRKRLLHNPTGTSHVFFRWFNEFPVIILIAICLLVVLKPQF